MTWRDWLGLAALALVGWRWVAALRATARRETEWSEFAAECRREKEGRPRDER